MPKIDVCFKLSGSTIPADHGYRLYGAICRYIPAIHPPAEDGELPAGDGQLWSEVGIQQVNAAPVGNRQLKLQPNSRLRIRIQRDSVQAVLRLIGEELPLGDATVRVGPAEIFPLVPAVRLRSRMVVIKGFLEPTAFLDAANRQLRAMGIQASAGIPWRRGMEAREVGADGKSPLVRRTLEVAGKNIVGYAVEVAGLTADESITLQENGIGGRRRFGCGIFIPARD